MNKDVISTPNAPAAVGPYSQGIRVGDIFFLSGQIPLDPATGAAPEGVEAQSRQALENLAAVLAAAGAGLDRVVKTTCFLADMGDFAVFNQVYAEYFRAPCPARSCVAVKTLPKGLLVEVEAVAALSE